MCLKNRFGVERFQEVAKQVAAFGPVDLSGKTRDAQFGARVVATELGPVTRMWLDGNVEIDFLRRNVPELKDCNVLDIGAGYGRLAVMMLPLVKSYTCVDAVAVSTELCRFYTCLFAPGVVTLGAEEFIKDTGHYDLAINIHCWNECTIEQVTAWVEAIARRRIRYLFTVDHGRPDEAFRSWNAGSYRPVLEKHYRLVKEETLSLQQTSHALWTLAGPPVIMLP